MKEILYETMRGVGGEKFDADEFLKEHLGVLAVSFVGLCVVVVIITGILKLEKSF